MINLSPILKLFNQIPAYTALTDALHASEPLTHPLGVLSAARPALLAALHADLQRPVCFITARTDRAKILAEQIQVWASDPAAVYRLPDPDALPHEKVAWGHETIQGRVAALAALVNYNQGRAAPPIIIASARALMHQTLPPAEFTLLPFQVGQRLNLNEVVGQWVALGYQPEEVVEIPGSFSRRGGILDIFPPNAALPVRIELFGDEIDSLRHFDPVSQRSDTRLNNFIVAPAGEALPRGAEHAVSRLHRCDLSTLQRSAQAALQEDIVRLSSGTSFRGIEYYLPFFYNGDTAPASVLDYLPGHTLVFIEDPEELAGVVDELETQARALKHDLTEVGDLPAPWPDPYFGWQALSTALAAHKPMALGFMAIANGDSPLPLPPGEGASQGEGAGVRAIPAEDDQFTIHNSQFIIHNLFSPPPAFGGQVKAVLEEIVACKKRGERVVLVSRQSARLSSLLRDHAGLTATPLDSLTPGDPPPASGSVTLIQGMLMEGWTVPAGPVVETPKLGVSTTTSHLGVSTTSHLGVSTTSHLGVSTTSHLGVSTTSHLGVSTTSHLGVSTITVMSDSELFGWKKPTTLRRPKPRRGVTPETFFADVNAGDLVVHIEHGIGRYLGLVKLDFEGVEREYLAVEYATHDKLYVPIHQADRLARYVGMDEHLPILNRLGSADWNTVKRRAKKAVEDIAKELLELYARREIAPGHAFAADTEWQSEVEDAFPFVETDDQLRAIAEVKADMEKPQPMGRLVCGDVGYGKTEVALRAAFKAVMDSMQVAILAPTTVLAEQHYQTFRQRLEAYPVKIDMLSRFQTGQQQQKTLRNLAEGTCDIVIGTHRLLQKDVVFKNLGLLVIDEEQRFGVKQKESLKKLRAEVDTLILTATPIPRTLHMSLSGVSDLSAINTPPEERLPIQTTVTEYNEPLIRKVILRELDRGGQVFYVFNRVMGIEQKANHLRNIVPEASVVVAHGQMSARQLERAMVNFVSGESDILVSTTIVENGLDMPNVNTIIIDRADQLGLAQLYQLRGRVGRGAVQAYAYLLTPKHHELHQDARKRLEAIAEASELGAGFRIAMRDLEIRGAGELLGARQHGHIAAVGFDLYTRLLAQAVREMKGEAPRVVTGDEAGAYLIPLAEGIQLNLPLPAYVPEDYLPEEKLRLRLYRRLADISTLKGIDEIAKEMEDRFGNIPAPLANLLYQLKLKVLALEAGAKAIITEAGQIIIRADTLERVDRPGLQRRLSPAAKITPRQITLPLHPKPEVWQAELEKTLRLMSRMVNDPAG